MNCLICGKEVEYYNNLVDKCSFCGFGVTKSGNTQSSDYHRDSEYRQEELLFKNIFARRIAIIEKQVKLKGAVLEIGCSTGLLLLGLKKRNWEVYGVEASKLAAQEASRKGLEIFEGRFEDFKTDKKFNLVILNHVLEHLNDPRAIIEKISALLTPQGYILLDVPNFGSLSAKIQKENWPLLLPQEHLWHFSLNSLELLLKKNNFEIIFSERVSGIWDFGSPLKELFTSLTHLKLRFFNELFTAVPALIISRLNLGTDLLIIAKKK